MSADSHRFRPGRTGLLIFGGSFHPIHHVHLHMAYDAARYLNLREVLLVPNFQTPNKTPVEGLTCEERFRLIHAELTFFQNTHPPAPFISVSQIELAQRAPIFTIDTLRRIAPIEANRYLLVGLDQFEHFESWRAYEDILRLTQVCVVNRPSATLPARMRFGHAESEHADIYLWDDEIEVRFIKKSYDEHASSDIRQLIRDGQFNHPWLKEYLPDSLELLKKTWGGASDPAGSTDPADPTDPDATKN